MSWAEIKKINSDLSVPLDERMNGHFITTDYVKMNIYPGNVQPAGSEYTVLSMNGKGLLYEIIVCVVSGAAYHSSQSPAISKLSLGGRLIINGIEEGGVNVFAQNNRNTSQISAVANFGFTSLPLLTGDTSVGRLGFGSSIITSPTAADKQVLANTRQTVSNMDTYPSSDNAPSVGNRFDYFATPSVTGTLNQDWNTLGVKWKDKPTLFDNVQVKVIVNENTNGQYANPTQCFVSVAYKYCLLE